MRDAIATTELFAEEPGEVRRSFIVAVARPQLANGGWRCRVKMTGNRFDRTLAAHDSLHALACALDAIRDQLASLEAEGWRFFAAADADAPIDASRIALGQGGSSTLGSA
jgi:hypothetical protein